MFGMAYSETPSLGIRSSGYIDSINKYLFIAYYALSTKDTHMNTRAFKEYSPGKIQF